MKTTKDAPTDVALWLGLMSLVMDHKRLLEDRLADRLDLPWTRFRALRRFELHAMTQRELADAMSVDAPAASVIVSDLAERGLVTREADPADARRRIVRITDAGRMLMADIRAVDVEVPVLAPLSGRDRAELARLVDLMRAGA
ncbi:MarR family winged helix-turn-helix transcriptional regulator [Lapillicoccus jejuensis]|uniref:DNA-binding MarR family transcriptional regulator n=1 Tax=Lapillicoccus jejuensis TaxID=402171 RepID=A0A542DYR1_9MICO|nr:MarR family transcriptional regulator [Lapillicoccus jejuensis]TQJ08189.1 DNA-binding MarR family transcriptional regulator [Lapillicoccus jejuensis]